MLIRNPSTRGYLKNDWIESRRTFSNNSYWDPIQVINDDILHPGYMVPKHEHKNFEIIGYLVDGELEHWDSLGNLNRAVPGQIQHMSCGKSIWHTEKCVSEVPARYLQIWLTPTILDTEPAYEVIEKTSEFSEVKIDNQSVKIRCGNLSGMKSLNIENKAYLYVVSGEIYLESINISDGFGIELDSEILEASFNAHIILFEF